MTDNTNAEYDLTELGIELPELKYHTKRTIAGSKRYLEWLETEREFPGAMTKPTWAFDVFENIPDIIGCIGDFIDDFTTTDGKRTYHNSGFLIYNLEKVRRILDNHKKDGQLQSRRYWIQRDMNSNDSYLTIRGII